MTTPLKPFVVCIAGPTATGKTDAAVAVCRALNGEVLSMDSMQIYGDMDIGTAKPSAAEMSGITHHLLSHISPKDAYTVAEYQRDARRCMQDVLARGKLPVFVGGTGLYLQAVSRPLSFTKADHGDDEIRAALEAEARTPDGIPRLHNRLRAVDPASAENIHPNNARRVIRALEVYAQTGIPYSMQQQEWDADPNEDWCILALDAPRAVLYERINRRVDRMMEAGLIGEVEALLKKGIPRDAQAMQAIGYKEIIPVIDGECTAEEAAEAIKQHSRRYAKRQLTWFRRDPRIHWLDTETFESPVDMYQEMIRVIRSQGESRE